ncbi:MAG: DUF445 family protein [Eubacterium sp.]|nr:DUF445 family protein [Eubacterium sp.]MDD7210428.1 DUF445 family protein [Lachnospiraceae bacterium]MDY5498067.1 DUF445 family protein [Anaerobutyricum sp.]
MVWKYVAAPVIGAVIGYVTNWIAVKMLFRPRREIRVFGRKLPFTPGVIPRGKGRLARAVGNVIETQLFTPEFLSEKLLSDEAEKKFKEGFSRKKDEWNTSSETIRSCVVNVIPEEKFSTVMTSVEESITNLLYEKIIEINPGKIIVDQVMDEAKSKLSDSMFGMMLGGSLVEKIGEQVQNRIDTYLEENARDLIKEQVENESVKLQEKTIGEAMGFLEEKGLCDSDFLWNVFRSLIERKLPDLLKALHLSEIVEERINAMKVEEVEELVLSIMRKELGTIVNLGALIGFVLGLVNVIILMI